MAKAAASVPRPRGRPRRNVDVLVTDVLIECMVQWLRGEPLNSDQAVRTVVNPARAAREKISVKALRERVREALSDASGGPGELLPRAFEVAQARA